MIFGKKKPEYSAEQEHIRSLAGAVHDSRNRLESKVKTAYCMAESIKVYPDGPNKEHAEKELEQARCAVINEIAWYDECKQAYNEYRIKHDFDWTTFADSDKVILNIMRRFLEA